MSSKIQTNLKNKQALSQSRLNGLSELNDSLDSMPLADADASSREDGLDDGKEAAGGGSPLAGGGGGQRRRRLSAERRWRRRLECESMDSLLSGSSASLAVTAATGDVTRSDAAAAAEAAARVHGLSFDEDEDGFGPEEAEEKARLIAQVGYTKGYTYQ